MLQPLGRGLKLPPAQGSWEWTLLSLTFVSVAKHRATVISFAAEAFPPMIGVRESLEVGRVERWERQSLQRRVCARCVAGP